MQRAPFSLRTSIGAERLGVERNFPKMEVGGRGLGAFATVPNVCRMREVGKESKGGRQRGEGVDFAQLVEKGKWEIWLKEPKGVPWREVDERPWSSVSVYVFFFVYFIQGESLFRCACFFSPNRSNLSPTSHVHMTAYLGNPPTDSQERVLLMLEDL